LGLKSETPLISFSENAAAENLVPVPDVREIDRRLPGSACLLNSQPIEQPE